MAKTYFIESEFLSFGKKINRRFHPAEAGIPIFSVKSVPIPLSGIGMVDFHQLFGKVIFLFAPEKKGLKSKAVNLQASFCHKGTKTQSFLLSDVF